MEEHDPGYDDWFDEPAPPTQEESGGGGRGVYDGVDDVWVLPEDEERRPRRSGGGGGFAIGGRTLTTAQLAILAGSAVAVLVAVLAAAGAFGGSTKTQTITTTPPPTTATTTTTNTVTTPVVQAPTAPLKPGDTGKQVKILQTALNALGFSVGKPDGDYGPKTQSAVEQFQSSKGLTADGVVGQQTLTALQQALSG